MIFRNFKKISAETVKKWTIGLAAAYAALVISGQAYVSVVNSLGLTNLAWSIYYALLDALTGCAEIAIAGMAIAAFLHMREMRFMLIHLMDLVGDRREETTAEVDDFDELK